MIRLGLLLLIALGAPALSRGATRWIRPSPPVLRRLLGQTWHLATLLLWGLLALFAGRMREDSTGGSGRLEALVFLYGLLWVESWFFLGLGRRSQAAAEHSGPLRSEVAVPEPAPDLADSGVPPDLGEEGEQLLRRILGLEQMQVDAIMAPRGQIARVEASATVQEALNRMRATGRNRLLVVAGGSLERVLGVAHAKDLVPLLADAGGRTPVRGHLRRALRVPSGQPVAVLLEQIRRDRVHLGIVGDSLGRTLGVVTLGDIYRHISGAMDEDKP